MLANEQMKIYLWKSVNLVELYWILKSMDFYLFRHTLTLSLIPFCMSVYIWQIQDWHSSGEIHFYIEKLSSWPVVVIT